MSATLLKDVDVNGLFAPISTRTSARLWTSTRTATRQAGSRSRSPRSHSWRASHSTRQSTRCPPRVPGPPHRRRYHPRCHPRVGREGDLGGDGELQAMVQEGPPEEEAASGTPSSRRRKRAWLMNIKVKLPGSAVPTQLHLCREDRKVTMNAATVEDLANEMPPHPHHQHARALVHGGRDVVRPLLAGGADHRPAREGALPSRPLPSTVRAVVQGARAGRGRSREGGRPGREPYTLLGEVDVGGLTSPISTKNQRTSVDSSRTAPPPTGSKFSCAPSC